MLAKDSSSVFQFPALPMPHPHYAIPHSGLDICLYPPYYIPSFIQPQPPIYSG